MNKVMVELSHSTTIKLSTRKGWDKETMKADADLLYGTILCEATQDDGTYIPPRQIVLSHTELKALYTLLKGRFEPNASTS